MPTKAPDLSAFARRGAPKYSGCWFTRLTDEQRTSVAAAKEAGYAVELITRVVNEDYGIAISDNQVGKHFRGRCACA